MNIIIFHHIEKKEVEKYLSNMGAFIYVNT